MPSPLSSNLPWPLANPQWAQTLNPIVANSLLQGRSVQSFQLQIGDNHIPHGLQRMQLGWFITDINSGATVFRSAPFSTTTLTLHSSAVATINLWVF